MPYINLIILPFHKRCHKLSQLILVKYFEDAKWQRNMGYRCVKFLSMLQNAFFSSEFRKEAGGGQSPESFMVSYY